MFVLVNKKASINPIKNNSTKTRIGNDYSDITSSYNNNN